MNLIHRYSLLVVLFAGALLAAFAPTAPPRWGWDVHRTINRAATNHLPAEFGFFAEWSADLEELSIAADDRKCCDPSESMKHYIDIDDYAAFFRGDLPRTYDEMVAQYGVSRVQRNGTAPWAIEARYWDMVRSLESNDWELAVAAAADIGHYVGDLHNPLHLTLNYNGQLSGQRGIHSRYESEMTRRHLNDLEPGTKEVFAVSDPLETVFDLIDAQYPGLALILSADSAATQTAGGSTSSTAYYNELWARTGTATAEWISDASVAVASLWYAAWLEAGSPIIGAQTATEDSAIPATTRILTNAPNPFVSTTRIRFDMSGAEAVSIVFTDVSGRQVNRWHLGTLHEGPHEVIWDGSGLDGAALPSGVYQVSLTGAGGLQASGQVVLLR